MTEKYNNRLLLVSKQHGNRNQRINNISKMQPSENINNIHNSQDAESKNTVTRKKEKQKEADFKKETIKI